MDQIKPHAIYADDKNGDRSQIAWVTPAKWDEVRAVMATPVEDNTRSDFVFVRLQDGTLVLGVFPLGSTRDLINDIGVCKFQQEQVNAIPKRYPPVYDNNLRRIGRIVAAVCLIVIVATIFL